MVPMSLVPLNTTVSTPGNPTVPNSPLTPSVSEGAVKLGDLFGLGTGVLGGYVPVEPGAVNPPGGTTGGGTTGGEPSGGGTTPPPGTPSQPGTGSGTPEPPPPPLPPSDGTKPFTPEDLSDYLRGLNSQIIGALDPGLGGLMSSNPAAMLNLPFLMSSIPTGTQALLAKPLNYSTGKPNAMTGNNLANGIAQAAAIAGPVTGSMTAFAGEGGATGAGGYLTNTGAAGDPWVYNQMPGKSKYPSGTGPGGYVFMPPEVDLQYARNYGLVPPGNVTVSTMYVLCGPGAWFGAGVPELGNGTMKDGWIWGMDSTTGDLVWKVHISSQVAVESIRFVLSTGNIKWKSTMGAYGELEHANSANRTYTFPDRSGVLLITGSGAGPPVDTTDIHNGESVLWKDTSSGEVRLYYDDAGVLKSVLLS